jgi:hypothetical protein
MNDVVPFPGVARIVDGVGRPCELRREPGEALYDYMKRVAKSREAEIERLNRVVASLGEAQDLFARRVRRIIYLETAIACSSVGIILMWPGVDAAGRIAALVLLPLALIGTGIGVFHQAPRIERLVAMVRRWRAA